MARTARTKIDTRAARLRLKPRPAPYSVTIAARRRLGYVRAAAGAGRWLAIVEVGRGPTGAAHRRRAELGLADDVVPADGAGILSYAQALAAAGSWHPKDGPRVAALTVRDAIKSHIDAKRASDGEAAAADKAGRLRLHVLREDEEGKPLPGPRGLGDREVGDLTLSELRTWRDALVEGRARTTVNRVVADLKAALNFVFADERSGIASDSAWRKLEAFEINKGVRVRREDHFTTEESLALIEEARKIDPCFGNLCEAAFHTGARAPGELAALDVRHFNLKRGTLAVIDGKTGARTVTLSSEGIAFFERITEGKKPGEILLPRADGERWGKSEQHRPVKKALKAAGLPNTASLYALRHSYISRAIENGMPILVLAENCGTSVGQIEKHYAHLLAAQRRALIEQHAPRLRVVASSPKAAA